MRHQSIDEAVDELLEEAADRADEESTSQYYYWSVWHRPLYEWKQRQQTDPVPLTSAAASNRHIDVWNTWSRQLGLSGGWLYVGRYYWTGDRWHRDRCDLRDLRTMQFYACA
jgi:hypothetical protein